MKEPKNIIGPSLRKLRDQRGWSQPRLAVEFQKGGLDYGRDIIARIEGQTRWVSDMELITIAKILKISPLDLLFGQTGKTLPRDKQRFLR